jgi:hypothetical protein
MVAPFCDFLQQAGTDRVLDLCSGAGGATFVFADEMARQNKETPRFVLTDLFPREQLWRKNAPHSAADIEFCDRPVDATHAPNDLADGAARTIHNAFHHFQPEQARAILKDAIDNSSGIFISEMFPRRIQQLAHIVVTNLWLGPGLPLRTNRSALERLSVFLLSPLILAGLTWDGFVSTLRVYTEEELRALVAPLGDKFEWTYGTCRYGLAGETTYFFGVPR